SRIFRFVMRSSTIVTIWRLTLAHPLPVARRSHRCPTRTSRATHAPLSLARFGRRTSIIRQHRATGAPAALPQRGDRTHARGGPVPLGPPPDLLPQSGTFSLIAYN